MLLVYFSFSTLATAKKHWYNVNERTDMVMFMEKLKGRREAAF